VLRREAAPMTARRRTSMPRQKRHRSKQDYGTPRIFLDAVERKFGPIAFDLAARADNCVVPRFYSPAQDTLVQSWRVGGLAWLNPEYTNIAPYVAKAVTAAAQGQQLVMLVPAGVGSNWWKRYVHERAKVHLLNGRITFVGCTDAYPKDCVLLEYGPDVEPGYVVWTWPADVPTRCNAEGSAA
jgi:phage N-6-adenine-methyltransferase